MKNQEVHLELLIKDQLPDYRFFFESAPGLYLILAPDLRVVAASNAYLRATMTERNKIFGHVFFDVFPENQYLRASLDLVRQLRTSDTMAAQDYDARPLAARSGSSEIKRWRSVNTPLKCVNGEITHIVHQIEDVTAFTLRIEQMESEMGLRAQALEIADEAKSLAAEEKKLAEVARNCAEEEKKRADEEKRRADSANRELEAFSYSVAHDLRAPLRGIDGFSNVLLEDYQDKLDAEGKGHLERIRSGCQRMGYLIDDLLNLASISRSPLRTSTVDLSALAVDIAAEMRATEPARQVEFKIQKSVFALGDRGLLQIAMQNLIANAWKYTGKTPSAVIEFGEVKELGQMTYFVRDNGAGFNMEYSDKLFGVFQRLHSKNDFPGTGVGLATVRRIINRHNGEIWAYGSVGQGASFHFVLDQAREME